MREIYLSNVTKYLFPITVKIVPVNCTECFHYGWIFFHIYRYFFHPRGKGPLFPSNASLRLQICFTLLANMLPTCLIYWKTNTILHEINPFVFQLPSRHKANDAELWISWSVCKRKMGWACIRPWLLTSMIPWTYVRSKEALLAMYRSDLCT